MQTKVKIKNSGYIHIEINKQLVKKKRILIKLINFSFKVFNINRTKNREVTKMILLEIKINEYKEQLEATVTNLNELVKYNLKVK